MAIQFFDLRDVSKLVVSDDFSFDSSCFYFALIFQFYFFSMDLILIFVEIVFFEVFGNWQFFFL